MSQEQQSNPAAAIVDFCRFAGEHGLPAGVKETLVCLRAAEAIGLVDRANVKFALRAVLCSSKDDWDAFNTLFEAYWGRRNISPGHSADQKKDKPSAPPSQ